MKRAIFGGAVLGIVAMALLAAVEVVGCLLKGAVPQGPSGAKFRWAASLAGILIGAGPLLGLLAGAVIAAVDSAAASVAKKRLDEPMWAARIYAGLMTVPVALFCTEVFQGRRARLIPLKDLWAVLLGAALLGLFYLVARLLLAERERLVSGRAKPLEAWSIVAALFAFAVGFHLADRFVLPGLYGFFHAALAVLAIVCAFLATFATYLRVKRVGRRVWAGVAEPRGACIASLVCILAGGFSVFHIARSQRTRSTAFRRTVLASKMLRALRRVGMLPKPKSLQAVSPPAVIKPKGLGPRRRGADLVLITVDALRADHVGLWGYSRKTTPNIDRIFGRGARFQRAYSPMPQTSYAMMSLFTGRYLSSPKKLRSGRRYTTLPDVLKRFQYKTAAFYPPSLFYIDRRLFKVYEQTRMGFEYSVVQYHKSEYDDDAAERTDRAIQFVTEWVRKREKGDERGENLFLWLHYFDPHHPYQARTGFDFGTGGRDRYDSEIAYVDAQVGRLHSFFKKTRPNAVFVLTGDHGEAFGEHDSSAHGTTLFDEQVRVPLLVAGKGIFAKVIKNPVDLVDLAPTLLSLLDLPLPATMQGNDLTPYMGEEDSDGTSPAFSEVHVPGGRMEMVALGVHKLIKDHRDDTLELYDLSADPKENNPLDIDSSGKDRGRAKVLMGHLVQWRSRMASEGPVVAASGGEQKDPFKRLGSPDAETRRLAAAALMARPPKSRHKSRVTELMEKDPDPEVRHRCAILAARFKVKKGLDRTDELLKRPDLPPAMRISAALALAEASRSSAVGDLIAIFPTVRNAFERKSIIAALGRLRDRRALDLLVDAVDDPGVQLVAARALGRLGDPRAAKRLFERLDGEKSQVSLRKEAVVALARLRLPEVMAGLAKRVRSRPEPLVRATLLAELAAGGFPIQRIAVPHVGTRTLRSSKGWDCTEKGCRPEGPARFRLPADTRRRSRNGSPADNPGGAEIWLLSTGESGVRPKIEVNGKPPSGVRRFRKGRVIRVKAKDAGTRPEILLSSWPAGLRLNHVVWMRTFVSSRKAEDP